MKLSGPSFPTTVSRGNSWEAKTWWGAMMRIHCCILTVVVLFADVLQAQQFTWRNDILADGQNGFVQTGFVDGDIGAAVFDVPCSLFPLEIKSVQVFWRSQFGPTTQVMAHVHLYGSGGPDPGSPLYTAEGALMTAGYMNDFSVAGLGWAVNQGPFTVGVEYVNDLGQPVSTASGHLTTDDDGCQADRNLVYNSTTAQWVDPCAAGMSGDFVIRVVFESMGTGCLGDSDCDADVDVRDFGDFLECFSGGGVAAVLECLPFDCDGDTDVDLEDYAAFAGCVAGPGTACNPACATCLGNFATGTRSGYSRTQSRSVADVLRIGSVDSVRMIGFPGAQLDGGANDPVSWSLVQISVGVAIVSIILVGFIGPCWSATCRATRGQSFRNDAIFPSSAEMARINQGLVWLSQANDWEATEAGVWYDARQAGLSELTGLIQVNHWTDPELIGASSHRLSNNIVIHVKNVTGSNFSPEFMALLLFAEWQHKDRPGASEPFLEERFKAFRERVGLTEVHPEFQHGPQEPEGQ